MKLIKLTRLDGTPFYVAPAWIMAVHAPTETYLKGAHTELVLSGFVEAVKETPEEVVNLLKEV